MTPFYPEAVFNVGNAMLRNKYIYCLSDAAVVVHSGNPKTSKNGKGGGTWTGALENLKKSWVPLWVKRSDDIKSGNEDIARAGGFWLSEYPEKIDVANLFLTPEEHSPPVSLDIFSQAEPDPKVDIVQKPKSSMAEKTESSSPNVKQIPDSPPESFYGYFLLRARSLLIEPKGLDEIVGALEVNKSQLNQWLKQAVEEKNIIKFSRPVRYVWNEASDSQGVLL
jgi:predicted Rossmann fold nucleotide-binding protein DprA/Smf involved in DNA uptake